MHGIDPQHLANAEYLRRERMLVFQSPPRQPDRFELGGNSRYVLNLIIDRVTARVIQRLSNDPGESSSFAPHPGLTPKDAALQIFDSLIRYLDRYESETLSDPEVMDARVDDIVKGIEAGYEEARGLLERLGVLNSLATASLGECRAALDDLLLDLVEA